MMHKRRPYEHNTEDDDSIKGRFEDKGRDLSGRWRHEKSDDWGDDDGNRTNPWKNGDNRNDRTDGWSSNEKIDPWTGKKYNWSDRDTNRVDRDKNRGDRDKSWSDKAWDRNTCDRKDDWNSRDNRSHWNDRKESWNRRRDDPWDENKDRRDGGDDSRSDSYQRDRDRRGRSRDRRDRSRDRSRERDSDRSRDNRRSSSKSPDTDNQRSSLAGEWICKCGALNFKRRVSCFRARCGASRSEAVSVVTDDRAMAVKQEDVNAATMISTQQYTAENVPALAAYSAQMYAKNKAEEAMYLKYYTDYYTQLLNQKKMNSLEGKSEVDKVNAAAAVAQSAISQIQAKSTVTSAVKVLPTGTDNKVYPAPDISSFLYDQTSGYYYDSVTGLYYDANTQYFYNNQINQYLYWDSTRNTYILASTLQNYVQSVAPAVSVPTAETTQSTNAVEDDKKAKPMEKADKVKVAKKIAKDMERWAKAMNQKKEALKVGSEPQANSGASNSKSADIGFSILDQKVSTYPQAPSQPTVLIPSYAGGSDDSSDDTDSLIDWEKLACLLCKRQFPSKEVLKKHQTMSELHKQNLENLKGQREDKPSSSRTIEQSTYRDRAAERRMKYGDDDAPIVRTVRPDPIVPSVPQEIGEENIGNRLLKKMGWTAGTGLGKEGQGILGPVEATTTGLGRKKGIYTAGPGETYRGCVKKLTMARYQDLIGSEGNS